MGGLNDSQKRYVASVFSEINHYLENIEGLIHAKQSSFHDVKDDITPRERAELTAFICAAQAEILGIWNTLRSKSGHAAVSARWSISTNLEFASIELMELTRAKLTGYGPLDEQAFHDLKIRIDQLQQMVGRQIGNFWPADSGGE